MSKLNPNLRYVITPNTTTQQDTLTWCFDKDSNVIFIKSYDAQKCIYPESCLLTEEELVNLFHTNKIKLTDDEFGAYTSVKSPDGQECLVTYPNSPMFYFNNVVLCSYNLTETLSPFVLNVLIAKKEYTGKSLKKIKLHNRIADAFRRYAKLVQNY